MTMLFDTHAHMDDRAFDADRAQLLRALPEQGISYLMNPGCSLASSRNADALSKEYDYIYAAVGSHPDAADEVNEEVLEEYRKLCKQNPKIRAIGEIGLDYHYEDIPRDLQQKAFRAQMELAAELQLPVIVHERDAHADGMQIVSEFSLCGQFVQGTVRSTDKLEVALYFLVRSQWVKAFFLKGVKEHGLLV
jgi:TatD DNase family protein